MKLKGIYKNINLNDVLFCTQNNFIEEYPLVFSNSTTPDGYYKTGDKTLFYLDGFSYEMSGEFLKNTLIKYKNIENLDTNNNKIISIYNHIFYKVFKKLKEKNINPNMPEFDSEIYSILIDLYSFKFKEKYPEKYKRVTSLILNIFYKKYISTILNQFKLLYSSIARKGYVQKENYDYMVVLKSKNKYILTNGIHRYFCCLLLNIENIPVILEYKE